jgi:hypothetical protein
MGRAKLVCPQAIPHGHGMNGIYKYHSTKIMYDTSDCRIGVITTVKYLAYSME